MLRDDAIVLRPPDEGDVTLIREAAADPYVVEITSVPSAATDEAAREWLGRQRLRREEDSGWPFVVVDAANGEPIGFVGLGRVYPDVAQTGYFVLARARRRGVASRALRLVVAYALDELGFHRVQALIEPWNEASIRVAESAGMRREGLLRGHYRRRDVYMYAILADDPR